MDYSGAGIVRRVFIFINDALRLKFVGQKVLDYDSKGILGDLVLVVNYLRTNL